MSVYRPMRKGETSKFYICEFVCQGKRFQESTGTTSETVAKEYEKAWKRELERAAAGLPTDQKATRIRTVADVISPYLAGYTLNHRPKYGEKHSTITMIHAAATISQMSASTAKTFSGSCCGARAPLFSE